MRKVITFTFIIAALVIGKLFSQTISDTLGYETGQTLANEAYAVELISVIDGDTLFVKDGERTYKVRLIGCNTPESVHQDESKNTVYGEMASDYTKQLLDGYVGNNIYLTYDIEREDKYGRTLAYVYFTATPSINSMLNYRLIKDGYAQVMTIPPNVAYSSEFVEAQDVAKEANLGLWAYDESF